MNAEKLKQEQISLSKEDFNNIILEAQKQAYEQAAEDKDKGGESEWEQFQKMGGTMPEVLESDYEHRAWLLSSRFVDMDAIKLHHLVLKELSLANLPDTELALIYSFKMDCIEDWLSLGFTDLAKQRLVHMLFRLKLSVSVDAKELVLQHGSSNVSMAMPMEQQAYTGMSDMQEDSSGQARPRFSIRNLVNKAKGVAGG